MAVLHLSELPPLLVMVTTWPAGLGCPCMLLKLMLSGEAPISGAAGDGVGCTVNCTMTVCVLCPAIKEIVPWLCPAGRLPALTLTDTTTPTVPFNCPEEGVTVSHDAVEAADQERVDPAQLAVALKFKV